MSSHPQPETHEVGKRIDADLRNALHIDGVLSRAAREERDLAENDIFLIVGKEDGEHDVRKIVVRTETLQVFLEDAAAHQAERSVGIRDPDAEVSEDDPAKDHLDGLAGRSVAALPAVADLNVVLLPGVIERRKFLRIRLTVRIGLEDIVRAVGDRIFVKADELRTVLLW